VDILLEAGGRERALEVSNNLSNSANPVAPLHDLPGATIELNHPLRIQQHMRLLRRLPLKPETPPQRRPGIAPDRPAASPSDAAVASATSPSATSSSAASRSVARSAAATNLAGTHDAAPATAEGVCVAADTGSTPYRKAMASFICHKISNLNCRISNARS